MKDRLQGQHLYLALDVYQRTRNMSNYDFQSILSDSLRRLRTVTTRQPQRQRHRDTQRQREQRQKGLTLHIYTYIYIYIYIYIYMYMCVCMRPRWEWLRWRQHSEASGAQALVIPVKGALHFGAFIFRKVSKANRGICSTT